MEGRTHTFERFLLLPAQTLLCHRKHLGDLVLEACRALLLLLYTSEVGGMPRIALLGA